MLSEVYYVDTNRLAQGFLLELVYLVDLYRSVRAVSVAGQLATLLKGCRICRVFSSGLWPVNLPPPQLQL